MRNKFYWSPRLLAFAGLLLVLTAISAGQSFASGKQLVNRNLPPIATKAWLKKICLPDAAESKRAGVSALCIGYIRGVLDGMRNGWVAGAVTVASLARKNDSERIEKMSAQYQAAKWFCIPPDVTDSQIAAVVQHYLMRPLVPGDSNPDAPSYVVEAVATHWPCHNRSAD